MVAQVAGLSGRQNWSLILSSSARVSRVTYEAVIAVRYPELDAVTPAHVTLLTARLRWAGSCQFSGDPHTMRFMQQLILGKWLSGFQISSLLKRARMAAWLSYTIEMIWRVL